MSMSSTLSSRVESLNLDQSQTLKSNNNSTSTSIQPLEPRSTRAPVSPSIKLSKALSYLLRHGATKEKLNIRQDGFVKVDEILKSNRVKGIEIPLDNQNQEEPTLTPTNTDSTKPLKKPKAKKNARSPNVEDIRKVVDENEKKRFEILEEEEKEEERRNGIPKGKGKEKGNSTLWIRAVQGHSLKEVSTLSHTPINLSNLSLLLTPGSETPSIIHGTSSQAWHLIQSSGGLKTMKRNHIHLARGLPSQLESKPSNGEVVEGLKRREEEGEETRKGETNGNEIISGMRFNSKILIFVNIEEALRDGIQFWLSQNGVVLTEGISETRKEGDGKDQSQVAGFLPLKYFDRVTDRDGKVVWDRNKET